jgi:hypothetical protein
MASYNQIHFNNTGLSHSYCSYYRKNKALLLAFNQIENYA